MEIVSRPDMRYETVGPASTDGFHSHCRSPEEAGAYVKTLQAILRAIGSSDGNMEQVEYHFRIKSNQRIEEAIGIV